MAEQLTLAPSHTHDPEESRIAAAKVDAAGQLRAVLNALYDATEEALTDDVIAAKCGLLRTSAGTRRGIGVKRGLIERHGTGYSRLGNKAARWRLTDEGIRYVRAMRREAAA